MVSIKEIITTLRILIVIGSFSRDNVDNFFLFIVTANDYDLVVTSILGTKRQRRRVYPLVINLFCVITLRL